jgi:hypothetical protein
LQFRNDIRPIRIKIVKPILHVGQTSLPDPLTLLERSQVLDMELHREKHRRFFLVRGADVAPATR